MKPLSETYKELGIAFSLPIEIKDANGNVTYYEDSDDWWCRWERDANDNQTYYEDSNDCWYRVERDANGNPTYYEDSDDFWQKWEYDANGKQTYCEDSEGKKLGTPRLAKTCEGKVVKIEGIKYELKSL